MELNAYRRDVVAWATAHGGVFGPEWNLARLAEEVGELARAVGERYGPKTPKAGERRTAADEEIGDVIFVLVLLADQMGVDPEKAAQTALAKAIGRDGHRFGSSPGSP